MVEPLTLSNPKLMNALNAQFASRRQKDWLESVYEEILARVDEPTLVVSDIARAVFVSERQFYRRLKKLTGMTPNELIQQMRMEQAYEIINAQKYDSVAVVAKAVGFLSPDYFSLLFERHYGIRPTALLNRA